MRKTPVSLHADRHGRRGRHTSIKRCCDREKECSGLRPGIVFHKSRPAACDEGSVIGGSFMVAVWTGSRRETKAISSAQRGLVRVIHFCAEETAHSTIGGSFSWSQEKPVLYLGFHRLPFSES
jgi:hypothetical protein